MHFGRRSGLAFLAWVAAFWLLLAPLPIYGQAAAGTLTGSVRDSQDHPVPDATVTLVNSSGATVQAVSSNSWGNFRFTGVAPGSYRISAKHRQESITGPSISVAAGETASVILKLPTDGAATSADPTFFDQPSFSVAGVTDTTNLAVHGSDKIARKKDELAKEVVDLASLPPGSSLKPGVNTGVDEEVRKLIAAKDYVAAEARLRSLLQTQDRAELHVLLGQIDEKQGNAVDAVREYQRAAEMDPTDDNLMQWGAEFLLHHAPDPAVQIFTEGTRRFPSSARLLTALGVSLYVLGSYEQATNALCHASDMDPRSEDAYIFLGRIVEAEPAAPSDVVERLARFAKQSLDNPRANYFYALALWKSQQSDKSAVAPMLRKATQLDPTFAAAYLQLGIVDLDEAPAQAQGALRHAIAADPQLAEAHFRIAQLYRKLGNETKSREELALYQQLTKDDIEQADRQRHDVQQFVFDVQPLPTGPR